MSATVPVGVDERGPVRMPLPTFLAHWAVDGTTGAGKTGALSGVALSSLRSGVGVTYLDPKGEAARDLVMFVAAGRDLPPAKVRVVAPFRGDVGVRFGLLAPQPGLSPQVLAGLLSDVIGRLVQGFGPRMQRLSYRVFLGGLLAGVGLRDVAEALRSDAHRLALAARVSDPETRTYLLELLPRERASADAVLARLEWILRFPGVAHALSSTRTLGDDDILPPGGLTVVDLGGAPQGSVALVDLLAQLAMLRATSAIFSRDQGRLAGRPPHPHLLLVDEAQRAMAGSAAELERILTEARAFKCALVMATQTMANRAFDDKFRAVLATNVRHHLHLRPDDAGARDLLPLLPVTGGVRDPARPDRMLDLKEEREHTLGILRSLPDREGLLCTRGDLPRRIRTIGLPYEQDAQRVRRLPAQVRAAYRDGVLAVPLPQLQQEAALRLRAVPERPAAPSPAAPGDAEAPEEELGEPVEPVVRERRGKRNMKLVLG